MKENYVLVGWPESQNYMEEPWFKEEALLALGCEDKVGSSAYFIPEGRILDNDRIEQRVAELCREYKPGQEQIDHADSQWTSSFPYEGRMSLRELVTEVSILVNRPRIELPPEKP